MLFDNDQRDHQQGEESHETQPELTVIQNRYPITYGDQITKLSAPFHLKSLYHSGKNVLSLFTTGVIRMNADEGKELSKFNPPLKNLIDWSMDNDENYFFTGQSSDGIQLLATDVSGKTRWSWSSTTKEKWLAHPPAVGKKNRIYGITNRRVVALDNGKLTWEFLFTSDSENFKFISVLPDNSLLVTQGKELIFLNSNAKKNWSLPIKDDILHPAVVDSAGHIYVTTATQIIKID